MEKEHESLKRALFTQRYLNKNSPTYKKNNRVQQMQKIFFESMKLKAKNYDKLFKIEHEKEKAKSIMKYLIHKSKDPSSLPQPYLKPADFLNIRNDHNDYSKVGFQYL